MPAYSRGALSRTLRASAIASSHAVTPTRCMPTSSSTYTRTGRLAARAARARSSTAFAESSATVSESSRGRAIRRASLGPIAGYASRMSSHTALITPASAGVAHVRPVAPCASCDAAIVVALCVLMCGRSASECVLAYDAMRAMLRSSRSRSTSAAGVSRRGGPEPGAMGEGVMLNISRGACAGRNEPPVVWLYRNTISESDNAITVQAPPPRRPHRQPRPPPPAPSRGRSADLRPGDDRGARPARLCALRRHDVPDLPRLEEDGLLRSKVVLARDGRRRRLYRLTPAGRRALRAAKQKVRELFGELFEHE